MPDRRSCKGAPPARDKRARDEPLGCEFRTIEIPSRQTRSTDIHLAGDTNGSRLEVCIEDVNLQVRDRNADDAAGVEIGLTNGRYVTCTVVSVMPYMLTNFGWSP